MIEVFGGKSLMVLAIKNGDKACYTLVLNEYIVTFVFPTSYRKLNDRISLISLVQKECKE